MFHSTNAKKQIHSLYNLRIPAIENPKERDSLQTCTITDGNRATREKSCQVDLSAFGTECTKANKFGYTTGEPCILIKLNRVRM